MRIIDEATPKAKKSHLCNSCLGEIKPGEVYLRLRCADDCEAWTRKSHLTCAKAANTLWEAGFDHPNEVVLFNVYDIPAEGWEIIRRNDPKTYYALIREGEEE